MKRLDRETIQKVIDTADIVEVVSDFVTLKRSGSSYIGLCPFHNERTPSFSVSKSKGICKCFSCGKGGNTINFLMELEHLSYQEAIRWLAKKYNIEIKEHEVSEKEREADNLRESLYAANQFALDHFEHNMYDTDEGRNVGYEYFRERGINDEMIRRFHLGYSMKRNNALTTAATAAGYDEKYLLATGLSGKSERDNSLYDKYRERVMYPIFSVSGRVIGFGGRILSKEKSAEKYINSPENEIYHKSYTLYGLYQAKQAIVKQDRCILVEGYMDVISMHQAGIENVVASSGTSLTEDQIRLIHRFTSNVTVIYDSDPAGIKASLRGIDLVLAAGKEVKVVLLPQGEDPDSFAQANEKSDIEEYLAANERDFVSFKMEILSKDVAENDIYGRTQMINDIVQTVSVIPDDIIRNVYIENVAQTFGLQQDSVFARVARLRKQRLDQNRRRDYNRQEQAPSDPDPAAYDPAAAGDAPATGSGRRRETGARITAGEFLSVCERELASFLLKWGEYTIHWESNMNYGAEQIPEVTVSEFIRSSLEDDGLSFENPLYKKVYDEYYSLDRTPAEGEKDEEVQGRLIKYFTFHDDSEIMRFATDILSDDHPITVKVYNESLTPEELRLNKDVPRAVLEYKKRIVTLRQTALQNDISVAEKTGDKERQMLLLRQLMLLNQVRSDIEKGLKKF